MSYRMDSDSKIETYPAYQWIWISSKISLVDEIRLSKVAYTADVPSFC